MSRNDYSHVAFADESNWNKGQYRSISLVTAEVDDARDIHCDLDEIRSQHNIKEFRWNKTNGKLGTEIASLFFKNCKRMRVDVLIWNMDDFRHKDVKRRDDREDFARMYFHLLLNVFRIRWPDNAHWFIFPDEFSDMNWDKLQERLNWKRWSQEQKLPLSINSLSELNKYYNIQGLQPVSSKKYLLVQMADLFAGLATYSHQSANKYHAWRDKEAGKQNLFGNQGNDVILSHNDKERLPILSHVYDNATNMSLQVSLDSTSGLRTYDPKNPLNFWLYQPQRMNDKAPVKKEPPNSYSTY